MIHATFTYQHVSYTYKSLQFHFCRENPWNE